MVAVLTNATTNQPSTTVAAYYDIWVQVYNLDFISIYPSSFTEGQGSIKWKEANFNLGSMTDTNWVRDSVSGDTLVSA